MKTRPRFTAGLFFAFVLLLGPFTFGQGPLTPPGPPGPTMKSLQELSDKLDALDARAAALELQNAQIQSRITINSGQLSFLGSALVNFAWNLSNPAPGFISVWDTSLAFGPAGHPAIAYGNGNWVLITRFNGTAWTVQVVDTGGNSVGDYVSLKFGPDGQPAIAFYDQGQDRLKFARYDGAAWVITFIDVGLLGADVGLHCSLAYGPDGQPVVAYYDATNTDLKFARFDGSNWVRTIVDDGGPDDAGQFCSLAFAPDGQPAIAYFHSELGVRFARYNGVAWTFSTANPNAGSQLHCSLAFGPDGQPAISYVEQPGNLLRLSRFSGTSWGFRGVDSEPVTGPNSLAFGPDGRVTIAYQSNTGFDLKFARDTSTSGGISTSSWENATVDEEGIIGQHCSLAYGPDGQPAISYYDNTNNNLKFARKGVFRIGQ